MSTAALVIVKAGLLTTVQDLGRFGHQASGVPVAGPMDSFSHRLANQLVGNEPGVTRDRHYGDAEWNGRQYTLIDTGGFTLSDARSEGELLRAVREQAQVAKQKRSEVSSVPS